jgi:hypothetical protein
MMTLGQSAIFGDLVSVGDQKQIEVVELVLLGSMTDPPAVSVLLRQQRHKIVCRIDLVKCYNLVIDVVD